MRYLKRLLCAFWGLLLVCSVQASVDKTVESALMHAESTLEKPMVDRVIVRKSDRLLLLMKDGKPWRVFPVALGDAPLGHKRFEGDERTPEGHYTLDWRNPNSRFYKSIHVSYPNEADVAYAESQGLSPGGMIMLHGFPADSMPEWDPVRMRYNDWTDGCIAVSNMAMDVIWEWVQDGTPIEIHP